MIVSKDWLAEYVDLAMPLEELTERLTLSGLNLEGVEQVDLSTGEQDTAIDLEVTSNRPDCLGHVGVAREIAVLWEQSLKKPTLKTSQPQAEAGGPTVNGVTSVTVDCPELCPRYTARVIKGVKIEPSPAWLAGRLQALGIAVINNVVDITNYVMMEIGQPLHAFDFAKLSGGKLQVRKAVAGEKFVAINHDTYTLSGSEVVIADDERPVALGGVMGGAGTEVSSTTVDVLIEAADFDALSVRGAARRHILHSPSSYRFERGVDPESIDWASRRCCELILELAGGTLCEGSIDVAQPAVERPEIKLRFSQLPRLLGVEIPSGEVQKILTDLGCEETHVCEKCVKVIPPSWRADLTREVDLIEEVARIYGYDKIPTKTTLPLVPSAKRLEDTVFDKVRAVMTAAGFDEAYTLSAVEPKLAVAFNPWPSSEATLLSTGTAVLRGAHCLRPSLTPSLLACRRINETLSNPTIELFEIAKVYLPTAGDLPQEKRVLALTSGGGYLEIKAVIESLVAAIAPDSKLEVTPAAGDMLEESRSAGLLLDGAAFCLMGELSPTGRDGFSLRDSASIAELDLGVLVRAARLVATTQPLSNYPPVARDLNLVVDEWVRWAQIEAIVLDEGGELLEQVTFSDDSYRDAKQLGDHKKSVVFRLQLRSMKGTLKSDEADEVVERIMGRLTAGLGGQLRA